MSGCGRVQVHDSAVAVATAAENVWRWACPEPSAAISIEATCSSRRTPFGLLPPRRRGFEELAPIESGARVSVHHGTSRIAGGWARVGAHTAQLRLAAPVVAVRGDRVVLRGETTLGGATVLDPAPPRRLEAERLELLEQGDPASIVAATVEAPVAIESLAARGLLSPAELGQGRAAVERAGGWAFSREWLDDTSASVVERLKARADESPLDPGLPVATLLPAEPWAPAILALLPLERRGGMAYLPGVAASLGARAEAAEALGQRVGRPGGPQGGGRRASPGLVEGDGVLVRLGDGFAVSADAYRQARDLVVEECRAAGDIALARFRDLAGVSRRDAQLLLERLDQDGVTRRLGDRRILRRAGRAHP